jgi:diguanylate cyclase (GGDEF)-like protein
MTDIDHFKNLNDTYGHQKGDLVLGLCAKLLRNSLRKDVDVPCRYGGEEFAAIMPATDVDGAARIAERVRQSCEGLPFLGEEKQIKVTMSIGIAAMNQERWINGTELLRRADTMLYEAKRTGRNRVSVWRGESGSE